MHLKVRYELRKFIKTFFDMRLDMGKDKDVNYYRVSITFKISC